MMHALDVATAYGSYPPDVYLNVALFTVLSLCGAALLSVVWALREPM